MAIASVNPATGEQIQVFKALQSGEIQAKIELAHSGFLVNRNRSIQERARLLWRTADLLDERKDAYGRIATLEMGKTLASAIAEVAKCAKACRHYAEHGEAYLADENVSTNASSSYVRYEPLGVVAAVMPWNFPFWQVFRFAAPALMAGNAGLLKHSSNVPQCSLAIEEVFRDAGFVAHEFQSLLIASDQVSMLIDDDRIVAVTLTGSEPAGAAVASSAAKRIKKSVLELGGSDPFIVMPSADLDEAVRTGVQARIINNGQSCIAAKRFIIHEAIADDFETKFVAAMKALRVGDPLESAIDVGPLAMPQLVDDLDSQVKRSIDAGARLLTGGARQGDRGNFYLPTVLADVPHDAAVAQEETFGPVATLFRVANAAQAISLANSTSFGLGASVWTRDRDEMQHFIEGVEAGQVFVNAMVASDPRVPFGGIKHSGFGRELGVYGIREFVNIKTVWIA